MIELLRDILNNPTASLFVIGNLVLIESLLSVDNAAVLATMVMELGKEERKKALKYGIWGAYLFRGISLFVASFLVKIWWLKGFGGLYLLYLAVNWYLSKGKSADDKEIKNEGNMLYNATFGILGKFWATVLAVEIMDMAFSLDNVFAAVAFSNNIILIICGVFIGILAMRFVAQGFVMLMERYTFLEACAYIVIALLGIKLLLSLVGHFYPNATFVTLLESHQADWITSGITICVFFVPMLTCILFGYPKRR